MPLKHIFTMTDDDKEGKNQIHKHSTNNLNTLINSR